MMNHATNNATTAADGEQPERTGNLAPKVMNDCGPRDVLRLAIPLIVSMASMTIMNFVDRLFLWKHSPLEFAAAMPSGTLLFALLCFPLGVVSYVNTFVAQYHGAGRPDRIGNAVWQAVRIGLYCAPLFLLAIPIAPLVFNAAGHDPDVARYETIYFQILTLSAGAAVMAAGMSAFFTGRGQTGTVMLIDIVANAVNIVLDYALIFGHWGLPEMGIAGAAVATVIGQWLKVAVYWWLMHRNNNRETYHFERGRRLDMQLMRRLFRYGGPNGLQMFVEMGAVSLFIILIGQLGKEAMTATNLAFNVNSVAFMPMMGMGVAVSTIVGQQLGRNRDDLAAKATWTALWLTSTYVGVLAVLYVATPDLLLLAHSSGESAVDFEQVREMTIVLLRFVAVFCLFDMMQIMFSSAIKGAGDTRFVLLTTAIVSPLPVVAGWIGIHWFGGGLVWCWTVITLWIAVIGVVYWLRFRQGKWRTMRVIEPDLLIEDEDFDDCGIDDTRETGGSADDGRAPAGEPVAETPAVEVATDPAVA